MNYSKKDVITGFVIILLIIVGVYLYQKNKNKVVPESISTPVSFEFKKEFSDTFKIDIPEDVNSVELKDISGGDSRGIATETEILVDANNPTESKYYEAWLEKDGMLVSMGKLQMAKGGWLLSYDKSKYEDYKKIIVSLEKINDNKIETRILEGSF
jgi:hypothetical protein